MGTLRCRRVPHLHAKPAPRCIG